MMQHLFCVRKILQTEFGSQIRHLKTKPKMCAKRIAVCQMTSVADKEANLRVVSELVGKAAKEDVEMLFFPEACDYLADNKKDIVGLAEPIPNGYVVTKYRELAVKHNVWLSMGGIHELDEAKPSKMCNTHIIINNNGDIVQSYRKLHTFDAEIPEKKVNLRESDFAHSGRHLVCPVETPIGRIGLATCYDLRFPEMALALSVLCAQVLTYPSAFTKVTGEAHWHVLLRARAIENQCYVIAAAQVGQHNAKRASYGHALVVDPWGKVLADCGTDSPTYMVAEIDPGKIDDVRRNMPVFEHKRRDIYSLNLLSLRNNLPEEHMTNCSKASTSPAEPVLSPNEQSLPFGHVRVPETCVFYKSDLSYAFVNLRCVIPGHVLVAPLRAAERNEDLTDAEATDFFKTIRIVQKLMEKVHNARSCTVTIQDGPDAGQTVKHLHCHVMPRKSGDFIDNDLIYLELAKHDHVKFGHPSKPPRTRAQMDEEAALLRVEIDKMLEEVQTSKSGTSPKV